MNLYIYNLNYLMSKFLYTRLFLVSVLIAFLITPSNAIFSDKEPDLYFNGFVVGL